MRILLIGLQVMFFAPVLIRLARRGAGVAAPKGGFVAEIVAGFRKPALFLHGAGLFLLWGGLVLALQQGNVDRSVTVRGMVGTLIVLVAALFMAWSHAFLRSWRLLPELDTGHQLCTTGPYAVVRHPMYLAINLLGLGIAIWVPTPEVTLAAALLVVGGDLRARAEERALLEALGERYRDYMQHVRRMVPGIY
jgi:protein-S-isoprenylcysteine O-methyltransferase Ste14